MKFETVRDQVREVLRCCPDARNSDRVLYVELVSRFHHVVPTMTLAAWVDAVCPDYETVRRMRAEVQSGGEFPPTSAEVARARRKREGEFREEFAARDAGREGRLERSDVAARTYHPNVRPAPSTGGVLFDAGRPLDGH